MVYQPAMRTDEHHVQKHAEILALRDRALAGEQPVNVVFLGDSLTRRWEDNAPLWNEYFAEFSPANLGVGADCLQNILWRVMNGEIEGLTPKVFVLLMGTNNLSSDSPAKIADGIVEIANLVHDSSPESKLILFGLYPRAIDENGVSYAESVAAVNDRLAGTVPAQYCEYRDIGYLLTDRNGGIRPDIMPDGLHLNDAGYKIVGPVVRDMLRKYFAQ